MDKSITPEMFHKAIIEENYVFLEHIIKNTDICSKIDLEIYNATEIPASARRYIIMSRIRQAELKIYTTMSKLIN